MRIAIIYNEPKQTTPEDHWLSRSQSDGLVVPVDFVDSSEFEVIRQSKKIEGILRDAGFDTFLYAASNPRDLCEVLVREHPELIFNCCETLGGNSKLEMNIAALFELLEIPFTGSSALGLALANDKGVAKSLFLAHGVPTPGWKTFSPGDKIIAAELKLPAIVKPIREGASIGIDLNSIVEDESSLAERVRFVWKEFGQAALVEEFIAGRELNVTLLAAPGGHLSPLPISEILFDGFPHDKYKIVTFAAKWMTASFQFTTTVPRCPAQLSSELEETVKSMAVKAAEAVQMRDYVRIDFRVRASDESVFVTEANPNADLNEDAGLARSARASGRTYDSLIREIVERTLERSAKSSGPSQLSIQSRII
jgi:D-alanine-D-alanine ligase